jgi:glycine/D-amino acid oxidase-like deaminating enzyme
MTFGFRPARRAVFWEPTEPLLQLILAGNAGRVIELALRRGMADRCREGGEFREENPVATPLEQAAGRVVQVERPKRLRDGHRARAHRSGDVAGRQGRRLPELPHDRDGVERVAARSGR